MMQPEIKEKITKVFQKTEKHRTTLETKFPGFTTYLMALTSTRVAREMQNETLKPGDILQCAELFTDMEAAKTVWYPTFLASIDAYLSSK